MAQFPEYYDRFDAMSHCHAIHLPEEGKFSFKVDIDNEDGYERKR